MATKQQTRRAAPPRPSLLVGDLKGCHHSFETLQEEVLRLQMQESASLSGGDAPEAAAWERLVPRCRAIRETLTSVHELSDFTRQVYEVSADICVRAGDLGEALKCLRQLVELIYATLAAAQLHISAHHVFQQQQQQQEQQQQQQEQRQQLLQQQQRQQQRSEQPGLVPPPGLPPLPKAANLAPPAAAGGNMGGTRRSPSTACGSMRDSRTAGMHALLATPTFSRWPEMAAALLLFYKCHQAAAAAEGVDTVITLRRLPPGLLQQQEVQQALALMVALAAGDYVAFFRTLSSAPRMVQLVVRARLAQVRQQALGCMAAAYRNIETAAVARMLGITGPASNMEVLAVLKQLADRGHRAAQAALYNAQTGNDACPVDLVFR